tara:strand:+ start:2217 stop:5957 length:3741 start_codon:yes stop_codon:yes gene_type:complete
MKKHGKKRPANKKRFQKKKARKTPNKTQTHDKSSELSDAHLGKLFSMLGAEIGDPGIGPTLKNEITQKCIESLDGLESAIFFSGLLFSPEFNCNTPRLEALIHLILAGGNGEESLSEKKAKELFNILNDHFYERSEDPAEDIMVGLLTGNNENFMILEGIWEGSTFQTQRFLDVLDNMPVHEYLDEFKGVVFNLLKLSNFAVKKAGLGRYQSGAEYPIKEISDYVLEINKISKLAKFDLSEIENNGISIEKLEAFIFNDEFSLLNEAFLHSSPINERPLYKTNTHLYLLIPTGFSIALRHYIIMFTQYSGIGDIFYKNWVDINLEHAKDVNIFGKFRSLEFNRTSDSTGNAQAADVIIQIQGSYFSHLLFIFDNFKNYEETKFTTSLFDDTKHSKVISNRIKSVRKNASKEDAFRGGYTLIVVCGWGRGIGLELDNLSTPEWIIEYISFHDLETLSKLPEMEPYNFQRLLENKYLTEKQGIEISNVNGLLNLYSWALGNNSNIIPHNQLLIDSEEHEPKNVVMSIAQNSLFLARKNVYQNFDDHLAKTPDNSTVQVCRVNTNPHFVEDYNLPIYASIPHIKKGELLGLIEIGQIKVWCSPINYEHIDRGLIHSLWTAINNWVYRAINHLDQNFTQKQITLYWRLNYENVEFPPKIDTIPTFNELLESANNSYSKEGKPLQITTNIFGSFLSGLHQEANWVEKALVNYFLIGLVELNLIPNKTNNLATLTKITINDDARTTHLFVGHNYIDYFKDHYPDPIFINSFDDAASRVGLAWTVHNPNTSSIINGKEACTCFFRKLIDRLATNAEELLAKINKDKLLIKLLLNHDSIQNDSNQWRRTARAMLSLHKDKKDVYTVISNEMGKRNSGSITSRLVLEIAICEASIEGGYNPTDLDISKLLTTTHLMFIFGGWSDAIHYDAIEPTLRFSHGGNVLVDASFQENIVDPFGKKFHEISANSDIESYSKLFQNKSVKKADEEDINPVFEEAWNTEFGIPTSEISLFLDILEKHGIESKSPVYKLKTSEFTQLLIKNGIPDHTIENILKELCLENRPKWKVPPENFKNTDVSPWRFKRRLSSLYRPIPKVDDTLYISPNLIAAGLKYRLTSCYEASFDESLFQSNELRQWIGSKRDKVGHAFNSEVAEEIRKFGWYAESDIKITKVFNSRLDKNYGDIDVLAWNPDIKIALAIECKNMEFAKTPSEIARQLNEFKGKLRSNKKPDRLLRHKYRYDLLSKNIERVLPRFYG